MKVSDLPSGSQDHHLVRVLIVDDTPQVLQDLCLLLELTGLIEIVAKAGNGLEAIRLVSELSPEVVVMDLGMPGMDGYEATRHIKSSAPAVRVIILSVQSGPMEQQLAHSAGADGFVVKGSSYEILVNAILSKDGSFDTFDSRKE